MKLSLSLEKQKTDSQTVAQKISEKKIPDGARKYHTRGAKKRRH